METDHFINYGYGWLCKHCLADTEERAGVNPSQRARFLSEGEAEEKEPKLSTEALARWRDASRRSLFCPRCGIEENPVKA